MSIVILAAVAVAVVFGYLGAALIETGFARTVLTALAMTAAVAIAVDLAQVVARKWRRSA